ncbi:MAG: FtsX-like permease family protein, partial [Pseudomonadota bacterium]
MSRPASPAGVLRWTLATLLSHWWRSPIQLAALVVGLSIATALWSGVQALNAEARASYDRAAEAFGSRLPRLEPVGASRFDQSAYVALRRAGWPVTPVLEGTVSPDPAAPDSAPLRLIGIDPLTMPAGAGLVLDAPDAAEDDGENGDGFAEFILPPHRTYAAAETMRALGLGEGAVPRLADGPALPPLSLRPRLSPGLLVVDVGAAQTVLQAPDALSYLLIAPGGTAGLAAPKDVTDIPLRRSQPEGAGDLDRLTESFHMNLTAFGLLAFLVGLFIVNAAIGLAFEQRRTMFRTLRATGVSAGMLAGALGLEMVVLALGAGLLGLVGGYGVAAALLPDVAASLRGLYGADVPGSLGLRPGWWAAGLAMSVAGAMLAAGQSLWRAYTMPLLAAAGPQAWAEAQRRWLRRQGLVALGVALVALALPLTGLSGLMAGFGQLAGLLLAAALLLPVLLAGLLGAAERLAAPGLGRWFWADSRQQLPGLSLALMALLLALGVNIGVGTMVGSFRATFTHWLDDRLAAEVYFRAADTAEARRMTDWLEARDEVAAVLPNWRAEARLEGWPVDVYGFTDDPLYRTRWPLLAELPQVWDRIAAGEAALVSEQLAYRLDLAPGERIALPG